MKKLYFFPDSGSFGMIGSFLKTVELKEVVKSSGIHCILMADGW